MATAISGIYLKAEVNNRWGRFHESIKQSNVGKSEGRVFIGQGGETDGGRADIKHRTL